MARAVKERTKAGNLLSYPGLSGPNLSPSQADVLPQLLEQSQADADMLKALGKEAGSLTLEDAVAFLKPGTNFDFVTKFMAHVNRYNTIGEGGIWGINQACDKMRARIADLTDQINAARRAGQATFSLDVEVEEVVALWRETRGVLATTPVTVGSYAKVRGRLVAGGYIDPTATPRTAAPEPTRRRASTSRKVAVNPASEPAPQADEPNEEPF